MDPPGPVKPPVSLPPPPPHANRSSSSPSNVRWRPHKVAAASASTPAAPPESHFDRAIYGLMQPILGARMLFGDRELLRAALLPATLLAGFCALVAVIAPPEWTAAAIVKRFYSMFAFLAPLPTFLLAGHYARLAVVARKKFGYSEALPCYEPLLRTAKRVAKQLVLVAIGLVPVTLTLHLVPFLGPLVIRVVVAVWALHWIVVDAFDSARTLAPGQTLADLDALALRLPRPWFVRLLEKAAAHLPIGGRILRWFARRCDRLAMPFREEVALIEQQPWLTLGFALATAALLATPVLNLLFRAIVLIGAVHVSGRFEHVPGSPLSTIPSPDAGAPVPPVPPTAPPVAP